MISLSIAGLTLALQVAGAPPQRPPTTVRDSTRPDTSARRGSPIRRPVTAELVASAFHDPDARSLFTRARNARIAQDSTLRAYDATVRQRISVKAAVGSVTLEKLAYRYESVARVQWDRGTGAHIEQTGGRVTIPPVGMPGVEREALEDLARDVSMVPIPYFPGHEPMWVGGGLANREVNENATVNPLADGAEAYYTYRSGDSVTIRTADARTIKVRQIDFRPRSAGVNYLVGSLWIDTESGQLVRAAYRVSAPGGATVSVSDSSGSDVVIVAAIVKAFMPAMVAQISAVVVEYQRYDGYWLPRSQSLQGFVRSSFANVPVAFENSFSYASVNTSANLPAIVVDTTARADTTALRLRKEAKKRACDTTDAFVVTGFKGRGEVPVEVKVPCNVDKLTQSPDLPKSPFDDGDVAWGVPDFDEVAKRALSIIDQAPLSLLDLPLPQFQYGVSMTRYNRIEGLSSALGIQQQLGAGFDLAGVARIATADHAPRLELSLGRTNGSETARMGAYDRLVSVSEFENPLSFGSSLSALLFGRDDGFYYRAQGAEFLWNSDRGRRLQWRVFHEREMEAVPLASFSVGGSFGPNIVATGGVYSGASVRAQKTYGLDPRGLRMSSDLRLEGARGDSTYGRGALDVTLSRGLGRAFDVGLSVGGGSSIGGVPAQRRWYLGGTQTIRGQQPDLTRSGNAYWLSRLEIGRPVNWIRPSVFGDIGWTGDRAQLDDIGRPMSGVGVGLTFLDGAIRLDVARGIYPRKHTLVSFYLGSRF